MHEIVVRDAVAADVPFLRAALAKLNDEMQTLSSSAGFRAEGFPGLNIDGCLQRDRFLVVAAGESRVAFCRSISSIRHRKALGPAPAKWR